jgi:hypothetical protein
MRDLWKFPTGWSASMSRLVLSVLAVTLASTSISEARPSTTTMSCGQAAATVARAGAIVLSTGEFTYERYVATNAFCLPGEVTEPGVAPTTDSRSCQVGYVCRQRERFDDN